LDLSLGEDLFSDIPKAMFPLVGQIIEKGRNFHPQIIAVEVQAVYNYDEIAFRLTWHDMRAEVSGSNGPDLPAPLWLEERAALGGGGSTNESDDEGGFWGDEEDGVEGSEDEGSIWGDEEAEEDGGDFWGDEEEAGEDEGDFWGEGDDDTAVASGPSGPDTEFSDAVAIQFPMTVPEGVRRPYFIFGDAQNPVELWYSDLAEAVAKTYAGRGSAAVTEADSVAPEILASYDQGEWSVIFKRQRNVRSGISFAEGTFVPIAFSIWDGFNRERGNKRSLTSWYDVYLEPLTKPSPVGPMAKAGLGVFLFELLVIGFVRRRKKASIQREQAQRAAASAA
jgi:hypothetical protein